MKYRLKGIQLHLLGELLSCQHGTDLKGDTMLYWALMFLVVALIAGVLGFTGIAVAAAGVAKILFLVFLVLFVISLATHLTRRGSGV